MASGVSRLVLYSVSMKHSDGQKVEKGSRGAWVAVVLLWVLPLLLLVPNIALDITERYYTSLERIVNIVFPAGVYLLALASCRRNAVAVLCLIPLMALCAFQIVLLFLYGESLIAVDMFLNVTTTNPSEAIELLGNLLYALAVVCALYLPPIALAIYALAKGSRLSRAMRRYGLLSGAGLVVAGGILFGITALAEGFSAASRTLFPANAVGNIAEAVRRTGISDAYMETSEAFSFDARSRHEVDGKEIYVLVIGETSRAGNWQLNGYRRPTTPRLSARPGVLSCGKVLTESNTTHKSVPLLLTHLDSNCFGDSLCRCRSVIDAFAEAGYRTAWFSNQQRNGSFIDFMGERADTCVFLNDDGRRHFDHELCSCLEEAVESAESKLFVVLHTYGSHFNYKERYPSEFVYFGHDAVLEADAANRRPLIDAYDNTIRYTDAVIDRVIGIVDSVGCLSAVVYLADHGEDIFDDDRHRFLHASPTPTFWQLHVPFVVWMSESYRQFFPEKFERASENVGKNVSSSRSAFHTLLSLAGIATPFFKPEAAISEPEYREPDFVFLNDYNEAVPLARSGLRASDMAELRKADMDCGGRKKERAKS